MAVNLNFQCHGRGWANYVTSDGNRVNVGNFDENGLNVNNYWDDNRNYNIGLAASRQSSLHQFEIPSLARVFHLTLFG